MNFKTKQGLSIPFYYFFFFGGQCLIISYMNVYLEKHLGFTGSQLGLYTSITPLVPAFIIPLVGILCDRTGRTKEIFCAFLGLAFASAAVMSLQTLLPTVILLGIIFETARASCISLGDSQATHYCALTGKNYGLYRMGGSVGWVVCGMLIGFLTSRLPLDKILFPAYLILTLITIFFALFFPNIRKMESPASSGAASSSSREAAGHPIKTLLKNRSYVTMLFITVSLCLTAETCLSYSGNHLVTTLKSPESIIGLNTAFSVVPEFFFFPAAAWLLKKYGFKNMYLLTALGVILRFTIYFLTGNAYIFLVGSLLHCLSSGCYTAVNLAFMHKTVDASIFSTAVALYSTACTLAKAFWGYLFGYIYENFGSRYIFLSVIPLAAFVFILLLRSRIFDEKKQTLKN